MIGKSASAVASAVIRIGFRRSSAPRKTSSGPNETPSSCSRCRKWLTSMIPFRAAIPSTVTNPTSDPSERTPPPRNAPATPPTSANSRLTSNNAVMLIEPKYTART